MGKSIEKELNIGVFQGLREEGNEELLLNGYGVFFWGDENILLLDRGSGYTRS